MADRQLIKCNICRYPDKVKFMEWDEDAGKTTEHIHIVHCTGHPGIHPSLWNRHPDYDKFRKALAQIRKQTNTIKEI